MNYTYKTHGTCSQSIEFELDGTKVKTVQFKGGCDGNLKGIALLVEGMEIEDVKKRLAGIRCGFKSTSCPDQLSKALAQL